MEMAAKALLCDVRYRDRLLKSIRSIKGFGAVSAEMRLPRKIDANLYLECNRSANGCLRTIRLLLEAAGFPQNEAAIEYEAPQNGSNDAVGTPPSSVAETVTPTPPLSSLAETVPPKPAKDTQEKIGAYAKREIYTALAEGRVPNEDFAKLGTLEGTKEILGLSLTTCPLFSFVPMFRRDGRRGCWNDPASRDGKPVYVNSQWYEEYRKKLEKLLARWKGTDISMAPKEEHNLVDSIELKLTELLAAEFSNGVRPGSIIDQNKIRKLFAQWFDDELPADFDFISVLPRIGLVHDDKVFPVGGASGRSPTTFVKSLEERSHGIFFYDELFEKESDAFTDMDIQSGEMLRAVLRKESADAYVYGKATFTRPGIPHAVADIIAEIFPERSEWSREALAEYLPYVPPEKIASVLATDSRFVRVSEGTYRLLSNIQLDEEECRENVLAAEEEISRKGFFSLASASLERSLDRNGDVLLSAVQTAFSARFLSTDFDRHGKIICAKGADFDSLMAVRAFCRETDEVTIEELLQLERDFGLGGGNRSIVTAHEEMVRVAEDRFVAPRLVPFDSAGVDAALEFAVPASGVMPLVSLRSFVSFPPVPGWPWNAYLLESFLRRESAAFAFLSVSAAPRTACGAVVRKSAGFASVVDALARAVADAGISPTEKNAGDFLMSQGYIQRRRGVEKEVAEAARKLMSRTDGTNQGVVP